ncbi:hypothetical protein PI125_g16802 [Phytophthora idaei]|nr:hypothetical protein PI125_g16802 [Phytophthora idaei]KAG3141064.1 hypothetical protein PI126_g15673 [Phytophthora idaei]
MGRPSRSDDVLVVKGKLQQVLSVVLRWTCIHGRMMDTARERRCTRRRQALLDPGAYIDDQEQEATEDLDVTVTPTFSQQNSNTALHQRIERNRAAGVSTESNDDGDDRFEARTSGVLFTELSVL